jgi:hypothetical protein
LASSPKSKPFSTVKIPAGNFLRRKDVYEYTTANGMYDIELFENQDDTFYAIGLPRDGQLVVYGSNIMGTGEQALQTVVDKIERENPHLRQAPPIE